MPMFGTFGVIPLGPDRLCTAEEWADDQDGCTVNDSNYWYAKNQEKGIANAAPYTVIPTPTYTAASLAARIQAAGGGLSVWTADASKSAELQTAKANPSLFSV